MVYVYPKLSKYDLLVLRIGGPGLGNLLFPFSEAMVLAKKNDIQIIWPTWGQLKVGPFIRRENDKRTYFNLFCANDDYINKLKKIRIVLTSKKLNKEDFLEGYESICNDKNPGNIVVTCSGMESLFTNIIEEHELIKNSLERICKKKNIYENKEYVGVHIRFGDFSRVSNNELNKSTSNTRLPIEWYIEKIREVQSLIGKDIEVHIFSDASDDELKKVLSIPGTKRMTYGTSINDILALSRSKVLIASNSTFSMWASYLGRMPVIWYKNQIKQKLYYGKEAMKETDVGLGEELPLIFKRAVINGESDFDL